MLQLQSFNFDLHPVRAILLDDAPWWIASDIAAVLGYSHTPHMLRNLDVDEQQVHIVDRLEGERTVEREVTIISESGLFAAILKSRRAEAKAFRRWVTGTVLPQLRRTGTFSLAGSGAGDAALFGRGPALPPSLGVLLATVKEAHRLFGPAAARGVWHQLGMPAVAGPAAPDDTALAQALAPVLVGLASITHDQAAVALGLDPHDAPTRLRLGRALRLAGWSDVRKERSPGHPHPVYVFRPATQEG